MKHHFSNRGDPTSNTRTRKYQFASQAYGVQPHVLYLGVHPPNPVRLPMHANLTPKAFTKYFLHGETSTTEARDLTITAIEVTEQEEETAADAFFGIEATRGKCCYTKRRPTHAAAG